MNLDFQPGAVQSTFKTAYTNDYRAEVAVRNIVRSIGNAWPSLLMLFCGGKHPPEVILRGLRMAYPSTPIVGGSAAGAISREGFGYTGSEIGAVAIFGRGAAPAIVSVRELGYSEQAAGVELGRKIAALAHEGATVMLFYDSVAGANPLRLHPASSIVDGIGAGLAGKPIKLVGGGMLTDLDLNGGWVFDGWSVCRHAAVALVFPPTVTMEATILHGCRPASPFMTVTAIEGAKVLELDGRPALQVIEEMLGLQSGQGSGQGLLLIATLGEKLGDPFAPFDENAYVNRLILNGDRNEGSVTLFEPDYQIGTQVQIMARDNEMMLQSVKQGVAAASRLITAAPAGAAFCLYIDCAGRVSARTGAIPEEASLVVAGLPPQVPFLGFFSGVEIAPFGTSARALDWTGVLATVCYRHAS